jgi:hypothetical protein
MKNDKKKKKNFSNILWKCLMEMSVIELIGVEKEEDD